MSNLLNPLSDDEVRMLDEFLAARIDESADSGELDVGMADISALDGLLTALVSGPELVPPSEWLPVVWGDFEPEWKSESEFKAITVLMMRLMNCLSATLMEDPDEFEPLFLEHSEDGDTFTIVDEWCEGYIRGVGLSADAWSKGGKEMDELLSPLLSFTSATGWEAHELASDEEFDEVSDAIIPNVRSIHAFWLARR